MASGVVYTFGPFALDSGLHHLTCDGARVPLGDRPVRVLACLLASAGTVVSKDALVTAAWDGVAVTDNSLEQAVSALRRALGHGADGQPWIETVPRQGYRFVGPASHAARVDEAAIDALLAPHRVFIDGRAALESLDRREIVRARVVFDGVVTQAPHLAPAHVGLANAGVLQFEMTRADTEPDTAPLAVAVRHARLACGLDPGYGEAWATLGFVLARTGHHIDALAAARRAVSLEPDNWRHHLRLSSIGWGEERLRAARRTLTLLPGCALAHWLAATVLVARQTLDEAERELRTGLSFEVPASAGHAGSSGVGLHWLLGLLRLAAGDQADARAEFERELALEHLGHLYARESCANTWYAIGAQQWRHGHYADAARAFDEALARVARHPMARAGLSLCPARGIAGTPPRDAADAVPGPAAIRTEAQASLAASASSSPEAILATAATQAAGGQHEAAVVRIASALAAAPAGNAFWLLPIEPLLWVSGAPHAWTSVLAHLRVRAA